MVTDPCRYAGRPVVDVKVLGFRLTSTDSVRNEDVIQLLCVLDENIGVALDCRNLRDLVDIGEVTC